MDHFNHKIADKGWASMQQMLEEEMPVQTERRRRPLLWWFLLLLTAIGSGSGGYWYSNKMNGHLDHAQPQIVVQYETRYITSPDLNVARIRPSAFQLSNSNSKKARFSVNNQAFFADKAPQGLWLRAKEVTPSLPMAEFASLAPNPLDAVSVPIKCIEYASVAQPLPNKLEEKASTLEKILTPSRPRKLAFGPSIGIFTERFKSLNGASIGGVVDFRPSSQWGLTASLYYSYLRPAPTARPVASLSALNYAKAIGNLSLLDDYGQLIDPKTGMSSHSSQVYVPLERLDRFEMPIMAYLQYFHRLRFFMGPTISYTHTVQAEKVYALDQVVYNASDRSNDKAINSLAGDEVKRWQLGLQSGVGMRLGDRFELDFFYRINSIRTYSRSLYQYNGSSLEYAPGRSGQLNNSSIFTLNGTLFF
jgi:hypothetical protein